MVAAVAEETAGLDDRPVGDHLPDQRGDGNGFGPGCRTSPGSWVCSSREPSWRRSMSPLPDLDGEHREQPGVPRGVPRRARVRCRGWWSWPSAWRRPGRLRSGGRGCWRSARSWTPLEVWSTRPRSASWNRRDLPGPGPARIRTDLRARGSLGAPPTLQESAGGRGPLRLGDLRPHVQGAFLPRRGRRHSRCWSYPD